MSDLIPENVKLEVTEGSDKGEVFIINNKTITIGRDEGCDMVLNDEHVSLKHAQVVFRNDHFTVIDLGSLNKTMVNNNVYVQKNLSNGDIISMGKTNLLFSNESGAEPEVNE